MKKFLLTAFLAFVGSWVFAQERIAVFPFEDMDNILTRSEMVFFYRQFSNEFTNRSAGKFSVVPRHDVERLINIEASFQLNDFSAREKTAEMQRVLNGTQILSGLIGRVDNRITISVSLYTFPELQQLPGGADLRVTNKTELFDKIPELVQDMQNKISGGGNTGGGRSGDGTSATAKDYYDRGERYYKQGENELAIAEYTNAIRLNYGWSAYNSRATAYMKLKNFDKAIDDYTQAITLTPYYYLLYFTRGLAYINKAMAAYLRLAPVNKSDVDHALFDFTQAITLNPKDVNSYCWRGNIYGNDFFGITDLNRAIKEFEAALEIDPNHKEARENLEKLRRATRR